MVFRQKELGPCCGLQDASPPKPKTAAGRQAAESMSEKCYCFLSTPLVVDDELRPIGCCTYYPVLYVLSCTIQFLDSSNFSA